MRSSLLVIGHRGRQTDADPRRRTIAAKGNSTVRRRRLGRELGRLRQQAGLTLRQVHERTGIAMNTISAYERGHRAVREPYVRSMLELYGVEPDAQATLLALGRSSGPSGLQQVYGDVIPDWFGVFVGLEQDAASIRTFETSLVPGLLQTPEYYRALITAAEPEPGDEEAERKIAVRLERQKRLVEPEPLQVWAIVDEAVLRRRAGSAQTSRDQLNHLMEITTLPNVTLQLLPFAAGLYPGIDSAFTILHFAEAADPNVVFIDLLASGVYIEAAEEVARYTLAFDHLRTRALEPRASRNEVARMAKEVR